MAREKRDNNFNIIRFVAAIMVMAGHMAYIGGYTLPTLWGEGIQALGVKIFFLIGGFLIAKSWESDSNPVRYMTKRVFRIFPALIAFTLVAAYVIGPILSTFTINEYFQSPLVRNYLRNILLFPAYSLPGVFETNPYPNAVNGSLWTLPIEFAMYILVPIILILAGKKKEKRYSFAFVSVITVVLCCLQMVKLLYHPEWRCVIYGTDIWAAMELIPWYLIGVLFTFPCMQKLLNIQVSILAAFLLSCLNPGSLTFCILKYVTFSYTIFSFALMEKPTFAKCFSQADISYGLYLYGFFVQQIVVYLFNKSSIVIGEIWLLVFCIGITCIIALLSFLCVEKPMQQLSKKILARL